MKIKCSLFLCFGLLLAMVMLSGCDSDSDDKDKTQYSFYNESSRLVTLYYSSYLISGKLGNPAVYILHTGASTAFEQTTDGPTATFYWDYQPQNSVTANQVGPTYVVFTDRVGGGSSGGSGNTKPRPTPSGTDVANF